MPEMPEVESVVALIRERIERKTIVKIDLIKTDVIKYPQAVDYVRLLENQTIKKVQRKGKYIILEMDNKILAVIHLRMTGKLLFTSKNQELDKYACVVFHLNDENKLVYADIRRLGTLEAVTKDELPRIKGLYTIGAEPLSDEFSVEYLTRILNHNKGKIKPFLLNQKYIAGLGNIYVDESLAISKIHPARVASSLTEDEIKSLYKAINKAIGEAIADGGTSFRDYRNALGEKGSHQDNLYVYNRKGKPCKFCQTAIVKTILNGRGTYYCPTCQKLEHRLR